MSRIRSTRLGMFVAGASLLAAMLATTAPAAEAASPVNDTWRTATRVTHLPFLAKVDTRAADDETEPLPPGARGVGAHSVWYEVVARRTGPLMISIQDSTFNAHANLYRAAPGTSPDTWSRVAGFSMRRGDAGTVAELQAGKHYYLMISTHTGMKGGTASLLIRNPARITYSLARNGTYDPVDGSAVIHGTIRSTQEGTTVNVSVRLRQLVGTQVVTGYGYGQLTVGKTDTPWQLRITSGTKFQAGPARVAHSSLRVVDHGAHVATLSFLPDAVVNLG